MKTYTLTEVQELLRQQRELCSHTLSCDIQKGSPTHNLVLFAPSPLLPTEEEGIKEDDLKRKNVEEFIKNNEEWVKGILACKEDDYVPSVQPKDEASLASHKN